MASTRRYEIGVGLLLVGAFLVFALMAVQLGALSRFGPKVRVDTVVGNAAGLSPGAVVAVAGIEVGVVEELVLEHDAARLTLALDPDRGIRRDARARVRARSVLGEKYVELVPQSRDTELVADGDVLASEPDPVEIDEFVSRLAPLVDALDPEALGVLVGSVTELVQEDPGRFSRLVDNLDTLLAHGAEASAELPQLMQDGRSTLLITRRAAGEIEQRAREAGPVVARADGVLAEIEVQVPELAEDVGALAEQARGLVDESAPEIQQILRNLSEIDKWELRRLLREEGVLIRLKSREVAPTDKAQFRRKGQVR